MAEPKWFPEHEPGRGRYFRVKGKKRLFHLRRQPAKKMWGAFIDPVTLRYERNAEIIKKNLIKMGFHVRVLKVSKGYRIYWAYLG